MNRMENVLQAYAPLDSLLIIICPIPNRLQDFLEDPRTLNILSYVTLSRNLSDSRDTLMEL